MVSRTASLQKMDEGWLRRWAVYEVEMSQNDVTTLTEFSSTSNLNQALLVKMEDGSEMTSSINNNVVTATGSGTNVDCHLFCYGLKA